MGYRAEVTSRSSDVNKDGVVVNDLSQPHPLIAMQIILMDLINIQTTLIDMRFDIINI
jgi:hypothetical protein